MQSDSLDNRVATKSDIVELKSTLEKLGQSVEDVKRRTSNLVKIGDVRIIRQGLEEGIVEAIYGRFFLIATGVGIVAIIREVWVFFD